MTLDERNNAEQLVWQITDHYDNMNDEDGAVDLLNEYANKRAIKELEAIESKFPYNCAIEDYGWIWVDLKNRIEELKQN